MGDDDEGWWATGGYMFTVILTCLAVAAAVEALMAWSCFRFVLPIVVSVRFGAPIGERLWHRMRRRARRRSHDGEHAN